MRTEVIQSLSVFLCILLIEIPDASVDSVRYQNECWRALSLLLFVVIASWNHLFPRFLSWSTYLVKATYTQLLLAIISSSEDASPVPYIFNAAIAMTADVLPIFTRGPVATVLSELNGVLRQLYIFFITLKMCHTHQVGMVFWMISNVLYWWERRVRIREGRRYDYSILHIFEHLSIFVWLYCARVEFIEGPVRINFVSAWRIFNFFAGYFVHVSVLSVCFNSYLSFQCDSRLPSWFDPALKADFDRKLRSQRFPKFLGWNYWSRFLVFWLFDNRVVTWKDIEAAIQSEKMSLREHSIDVVVGILSGGGYIARCVAKDNSVQNVLYVRSTLWSKRSLGQMIAGYAYAIFDIDVSTSKPYVIAEDAANLIAGKRCLVVDDTVTTGTTMRNVVNLLHRMGAAEIKTYALYCRKCSFVPDYCGVLSSGIPFVFEWGWEAD